jgi:PAS domain S-box-containing protein
MVASRLVDDIVMSIRATADAVRPERAVLDRAEQLAQTGSWEWDLDSNVLLWSDNMFRLVGLEVGEITPTPEYIAGRIHADDRDGAAQHLDSARQDGSLPDVTFRMTLPDGSVRSLRSFSTIAERHEGRPSRLIGSVQDITELAAEQRQTAESLRLLETLQLSAPVGVAFVDCDFRIVRINQTLAEVNGSSPEAQIGCTIEELVPDVWSQMEPVYRSVLETGESVVNVAVEREGTETQDRRLWLASYYRVSIDDEVIGLGIVVVDITERAETEHFRSIVMDTMMEGLYALDGEGRLAFMNATASKILGWSEDELRGKSMHAAVHFQHADGSARSEEECELLKVRTEGRSVRMNHEAFTRKDGTLCPVAYSAAPMRIGNGVDGVVVVFRDTTDEQAERDGAKRELDALAWVGRTRDAIDDDRLTLYSQPIVPLAGGQRSQEVLLRMIGRDGEVVLPGSFLPVAERFGLIEEVDRWVIHEAVRIAATGQRLAANLSAKSISDLDLLPLIERELHQAHADPANIIFEITETAMVKNIEAGEAFARGLNDIGCKVALDDFGTGFASLTYLKKLAVAYLKIDVDFVTDLGRNTANQHLVQGIVHLAHGFGIETIAEGVEDAETLELLKEYGVDYAQGFHVGRPAPMDTQTRRAATLAGAN